MFFRFFRPPPPPEAFRLFLLLLDLLAAAILVTDVLEHASAIVRVRCREEWERNAWQLFGANVTTKSANDVVLRIVSPVSWLEYRYTGTMPWYGFVKSMCEGGATVRP